jgi:hypothetical protein
MNAIKVTLVVLAAIGVVMLIVEMARLWRGECIPGWIEMETFLVDNSPAVEAWIGTPPTVAIMGIVAGGKTNGCGFSVRESLCGSSSSLFISDSTIKDIILLGSRHVVANIRCTPDYTITGAVTSLDGYFAVCPHAERIVSRCNTLFIGEKDGAYECTRERKRLDPAPDVPWAVIGCRPNGKAVQLDPLGTRVRGREIWTPAAFDDLRQCQNATSMHHRTHGRQKDWECVATEISNGAAYLRECAPCDTLQSSVLMSLALGYLALIAVMAAPTAMSAVVAILAISIHMEFSLGYGLGSHISSMMCLPRAFLESVFATVILCGACAAFISKTSMDTYAALSILTACWYAAHGVHNFVVRILLTCGIASAASVAAITPVIQNTLTKRPAALSVLVGTLVTAAIAVFAIDPIMCNMVDTSWESLIMTATATFIASGFVSLIFAIRRLHHRWN